MKTEVHDRSFKEKRTTLKMVLARTFSIPLHLQFIQRQEINEETKVAVSA